MYQPTSLFHKKSPLITIRKLADREKSFFV